MAESIHTTLKNQVYVVNHQGNDLEAMIPTWLDITDITDVVKVEAWLANKSPEERLGFYHAGFDSSIIKGRAITRPKMKTINKIEDFEKAVKGLDNPEDWHVSKSKQTITKNILADQTDALERSLAWVPKPKAVPGSGKTPITVDKAIEMAENLSPDKLAEMLAKLQAMQAGQTN